MAATRGTRKPNVRGDELSF